MSDQGYEHPRMRANTRTNDPWHTADGHFYGNGCDVEPACEPMEETP